VLVHPGSTVHSLVEFVDGGLMAQLGLPDMRLPILYAIADERHRPLPGDRLDLAAAADLHFEAPDPVRFPCLDLARRAGMAGGRAPIVLNAANEEAVARLLDDRLSYADIAVVIEETLATVSQGPVHDLAAALATDAEARTVAAATADRLADPRD